MQFLMLDNIKTLYDLTKVVGQRNVDQVLATNGLKRQPDIRNQYKQKCSQVIQQYKEAHGTYSTISPDRKKAILNTMTRDVEIFEKTCLADEDDWIVYSALNSYQDSMKIPELITLPSSTSVVGGTSGPVDPAVYKKVILSLSSSSTIDASVFSEYSSGRARSVARNKTSRSTGPSAWGAFNLPWGKIQMYSTLLNETRDFPVYPEEISTGRNANYTSMTDTIYQYEPWIVYESSGPRTQELNFHFHRDMWSGDHRDGQANALIRFCEANCFPNYNGSSVIAPSIRFYINGSLFISGVVTSVVTNWSGPIGLDGFYLECNLVLGIQEVSETPLNCTSVRNKGLIG